MHVSQLALLFVPTTNCTLCMCSYMFRWSMGTIKCSDFLVKNPTPVVIIFQDYPLKMRPYAPTKPNHIRLWAAVDIMDCYKRNNMSLPCYSYLKVMSVLPSIYCKTKVSWHQLIVGTFFFIL